MTPYLGDDEIDPAKVPEDEVREVLSVLFEYLKLKLTRNSTPDYVEYTIYDRKGREDDA